MVNVKKLDIDKYNCLLCKKYIPIDHHFSKEYINNFENNITMKMKDSIKKKSVDLIFDFHIIDKNVDFNLPRINWSLNSVLPGGSISSVESASLLLDFMSENLCTQHILEPTRMDNVLDLYNSNAEDLISHISTSETPLSDHKHVEVFLSYNPCSLTSPTLPDFSGSSFRNVDFNKNDFEELNVSLRIIDWEALSSICKEEEFPQLFTLILLQMCELYCPRKVSPRVQSASSTHIHSRKKRKLAKQLEDAKSNANCPQARIDSHRRKVALAHLNIRNAINEDLLYHEQEAVSKVKENPKFFYSYAKKFSKKKSNITMLFDENGEIISNPNDIANLLQKQFLSVFSDPTKTTIDKATFPSPLIEHPLTDDILEFTNTDIIEAIDDVKPNAASGPDEIPVILLKNCKEALAEPIHRIWSASLASGTVPSFYKTSYVFPLHKKDSKALPSNYRPISLTSHITKIYERVIRKKLVEYLEQNDLICNKQHGFRSGRSCLTQLLHHFDDVLESLTNNVEFDSIYLDYAKAFDKMDHKLLMKKLHLYEIHSKIISWIESFLTDRKQAVVVDGQLSVFAPIISGVPQGTVLGPILFLIFINDIEHSISSSIIRCFADDTRISISIKCENDVKLLQNDLHNVIRWSERNNMALHKDKFEYMSHTSNKQSHHSDLSELPFMCKHFQYNVADDITLRPVHQLRDLGILMSSDLSWSPCIRAIANKARQKLPGCSVFFTPGLLLLCSRYINLWFAVYSSTAAHFGTLLKLAISKS